eukprot:m.12265 g.12265  ORF g.12265 m.12265 type:complete len:393 (-) comp4624_c0_seq1:28-1206(-)
MSNKQKNIHKTITKALIQFIFVIIASRVKSEEEEVFKYVLGHQRGCNQTYDEYQKVLKKGYFHEWFIKEVCNNSKTILALTWAEPKYQTKAPLYYFSDCPKIQTTRNRSKLSEADIVYLEHPYYLQYHHDRSAVINLLPQGQFERNGPHQIFMMNSHAESAEYYPVLYHKWFRSMFEITLGYHPGFDHYLTSQYWNYETLKKAKSASPVPRETSTELVAMMISNCHPKNNRAVYLRELMKHVEVASYGKCDRNKETDTHAYENQYRTKKQHIFSRHRFAIAFENSNCVDYITEKIVDAYFAGAIPVYMGAPNIKEYVPKNSYVDASVFEKPSDLAAHLKSIAENREKYYSYHAWRSKSEWDVVYKHNKTFTPCMALKNALAISTEGTCITNF